MGSAPEEGAVSSEPMGVTLGPSQHLISLFSVQKAQRERRGSREPW